MTALVTPMSLGAWCGLFIICVVCGVVLWIVLTRDNTVVTPYKGSESFLNVVSTVSQFGKLRAEDVSQHLRLGSFEAPDKRLSNVKHTFCRIVGNER